MDSNDKKTLDNSLESTMNMSQDDIEKLLLQYEEQGKAEEPAIDDLDLESLLAGFDNQEDEAIQDISELLNKSERNQAVNDEVVAILKSQEEESLTAYDAMDLFSGESDKGKESFWAKLLKKFKKSKADKKDIEEGSGKKEKKPKKDDKKQQEKESQRDVNIYNIQDNSMSDALVLLSGNMNDDNAPKESLKEEKGKKEKKKNKKEVNNTEEEEIREKKTKSKGKDKKGKNKEKKEKKSKKENQEIREKVKEKATIADAILELEAEQEEPPHKKKVIMTFAASILIMLGFLVVSFYFTAHANKRLAEEAYEEKNYLECYQLLYGQKMNDSQWAMYKRSECILKTDIFWRDYSSYVKEGKWLEGLDELTQYVHQYPKHLEDAKTWNGQEFVEDTYHQVKDVLLEEYETDVELIKQIAALEDDVDYTRALAAIAEEKEKIEALNKKYPDILPEEKDRLSQ
ncbi:MAG: hypothetical protein IKK33_01385 [Lachnospiraceae bacterium]|nr:hypothetical protein [Lachnospiraceae bacterium]